MNNKEIKALMTCNDILTKECAKLRNENEELKNRLSTIVQQSLSGSGQSTSPKSCANCRNYKNCNYQIERECDLKDRKHWVRT